MGPFKVSPLLGVALPLTFALSGCMQHHEARVQTALLPPPSATAVQHSGRLWVELGEATWENQCRTPKAQRLLCFDGVRRAAFGALERSLWTSFPDVALRDGEALRPGDYLLQLDVTIDAAPPDAEGPGWSAIASGGFRLLRDGKVLHEERLGSRSRAAFAYGRALGVGAGEVVSAFATHVAQVLGAVPEERPLRASPLPAVVAEVLTPASSAPAAPPAPVAPTDAPASLPPAERAPNSAEAPTPAASESMLDVPVAAR
ncbi:MAG: hypothetical protein EOO73_09075 [Myxococcales bacterium]|nr:MAG: hypothetical protein EOO73_09075 [Myxococcales bacterium]